MRDDDFRGTGGEAFDEEEDDRLNQALMLERASHPEETDEQLSFRLLQENAPRVALGVVEIALRGNSDNMRLQASKYVLNHVLGNPGDDKNFKPDSPLDALVRQMQQDAEDLANNKSSR